MTTSDPIELARAGRHLAETLTTRPDAEEKALRAQARRHLHLVDGYDGMVALRGLLDAEAAATLNAALDPLAAPRPATGGAPDPRTPGQRRADALVDLARIGLACGDLPETGGSKPALTVTIDLAALTGQTAGAGLLPDGTPLPAGVLRRLACDANITPAVLGGPSQPLDVGRTRRTVPGPLRAALTIRDQGCAFPGVRREALVDRVEVKGLRRSPVAAVL